jgi:monoamine oxidase
MSPDVVVIGAGISGLQTARLLQQRGARVLVVEARDRVGGRTLSTSLQGARFDLGGQWVGPTQPRVLALADRLGMARFETHHSGRKLLDLRGRLRTWQGEIPSLPLPSLAILQLALNRIDRLSRRMALGRPWEDERSAPLDELTIAAWCERHLPSRDVRDLVALTVRSVLSMEPEEVSFLWFLHYVRNAGGVDPLIQTQGGAQQWRFVDGAQGISLGLADALGPDHLWLDAPVQRVVPADDGRLEVHAGALGDRRVAARRVVVAMAPPLVQRITFEPMLSPNRVLLQQRMPMGYTIKYLATYPRAFWRAAGWSGESAGWDGLLSFTFDNTSHDGQVPCLVGFVNGRRAMELSRLDATERQAQVLAALARYFGPEAAQPVYFHEQDWNREPWSMGCPVASAGPGTLRGLGPELRAPQGAIHFAGTETATEWCGFMEGALQAAERCSEEVWTALQSEG